MEESRKKGTVTSLASVFPVEEAQKAVNRVHDAIANKQNELYQVRGFLADNNNLISLVQKLPENLSHDIMVPFGKAAFFPGRLIHTNEFLVLLGEGYYAERTSKQTVEILQRRGMSLDSQVHSLEANIKDLQAEASFFNATASEVAEGLVDIREDYVEQDSDNEESNSGPLQQDTPKLGNATADDEYARIVSIMDELEKEELAAESGNHSGQNDESTADFDEISCEGHIDNNWQNSKDFHQSVSLDQADNKNIAIEFPEKHNCLEDIADQLNFARLAVQSRVRVLEGGKFTQNLETIDASEKIPLLSNDKVAQATTTSKTEVRHQTPQSSFDSSKAFTGSIIEHAENIQTRDQSSTSSKVSGSQSTKPVSRFKMQRR